MKNLQSSRKAFTLVEILTVLVIIGLMGGMVLAAVRGVTTTARAARTRSIIAACDSVIQEQYDAYRYRPLPVEIPTLLKSLPSGQLGREVLTSEAARVRLIMLRDLQRMELPDRFSDFGIGTTAPVPSNVWAAASPVLINSSGAVVGKRSDRSARVALPANPAFSPKVASYLERYASVNPSATTQQILDNQSAECLYMIMSNSFAGGTPAISAIPDSNIGDTDGDGLPEILDGWGQPIGFIRWPVGYFSPDGTTDPASPNYYANVPDDFDLFRVDYAYAAQDGSTPKTSDAIDVNNGSAAVKPWSLRPLIVSAGGDDEFGLALSPYSSVAGSPLGTFSYSDSAWDIPTAAGSSVGKGFMGVELAGRVAADGKYSFPDPYLRRFRAANPNSLFPGQALPGPDALENRADNITNYSLQVSQ